MTPPASPYRVPLEFDHLVVPTEEPTAGNLAVIWPIEGEAFVGRLVLGLWPEFEKNLPYKPGPQSNATPIVVYRLADDSPKTTRELTLDKVNAIHKVCTDDLPARLEKLGQKAA